MIKSMAQISNHFMIKQQFIKNSNLKQGIEPKIKRSKLQINKSNLPLCSRAIMMVNVVVIHKRVHEIPQ